LNQLLIFNTLIKFITAEIPEKTNHLVFIFIQAGSNGKRLRIKLIGMFLTIINYTLALVLED